METSDEIAIVGGDIAVSTLSSAVEAAFNFAEFAVTVETIAAEVAKRQADFMTKYDQSMADLRVLQQQAISAINVARDAAIAQVVLAKTDVLNRPAEHNAAALPGYAVPTAG